MNTIYVLDGHRCVRQMLSETLGGSNFEVVGESSTGLDAIEAILTLSPQLVIVALNLPKITGIEVMRRVLRRNANIKFVVFSASYNAAIVKDALSAGAHGFIEKDVQLSELKQGLEVVAAGGSYFGPQVANVICSVVADTKSEESLEDNLTEREREVLELIALGNSTKDIAEGLGLSVKTIDNHRTSMMRKLGFHNVASITRYAVENRIVEVNFAS